MPSELPLFDVGLAVDQSPWSRRQRFITLVAALAILVDGFDNQALSFAIPLLIKNWGLQHSSFAPIFSLGLIGASVGTIAGGYLSDRFGRRPVFLASVLAFTIMSAAMATAGSLTTLMILRVAASIGLGAAMPATLALVAELSPPRTRTLALTLTIICFPLGGMLAGIVASRLLPLSGWRTFFLLGGAIGCGVVVLLYLWVPESPRFLVRKEARWDELRRILQTIRPPPTEKCRFIDSTERPRVRTSPLTLLGKDLRRTSIVLSIAFSLGLLALQLVISWLPTILTMQHLDLGASSLGLSVYNFGGVLGAVTFGFLAVAARARTVAGIALSGAVASALVLSRTAVDPAAAQTSLLIVLLGLHGVFAHASQVSLTAMSAQVYPTSVRAMGHGTTVAVGRIIAAIATGVAGPSLIALGTLSYFLAVAAALGSALVAIAFLPRLPSTPSSFPGGLRK
jgi:AAHS family 4-hydroxybenzoate transporter-like MFS transporter